MAYRERENITAVEALERLKKLTPPTFVEQARRPLPLPIPDSIGKANPIDSVYIATKVEIPLPEMQDGISIDPRILQHREATPHQLQKLADSLFRLHADRLQSIEEQISFKTETILHEKHREAQKLLEAAEKTQHGNFWDFLKKIAGALLGTISILVGSTLVALGGPLGWGAGSLLIASGLTSVTSTVLAQLKINPEITSTIALVSAGLGLVGSAASLFTVAHSIPHLIATLANAFFTVASGSTTIASHEMKRQLAEIDHEMAKIQEALSLDHVTMRELSIQAANLSDDMYRDVEQCNTILTKQEETKRRITALQSPLAG